MKTVSQSPTDPDFVQNPYPFYAHARAQGRLPYWDDYGMRAAFDHLTVQTLLRDRRFGREMPRGLKTAIPPHLAPFYAVETHSMLELERPRHTRLRGLVLRAFTSRRIAEMEPDISALTNELIDAFPRNQRFDLLPAFANRLPVVIIARLLGVPETLCDQLLTWSNAMVAMYQARRDHAIELAAARAASEFSAFLRDYVEDRRTQPRDDLISHLISAEEDGAMLSIDELISTCILLLNAGHEATVHTFGNGIKTMLEHDAAKTLFADDTRERAIEEILRYDPPLHMFTRYAYEDVELFGHTLKRGDQVALMLAAANRDAKLWDEPERFIPTRPIVTHASFGAGVHFCLGAPLARLELHVALPILFERCPGLRLSEPPRYANLYHFHGLEKLMVTT